MCYKNFATMGLEYKIHTGLQEFRSAAADSNAKCLIVSVKLFCLSAPEERNSWSKTCVYHGAPAGRYSCRLAMHDLFNPLRRHSCECHLPNKLNFFNKMVGTTGKWITNSFYQELQ
jgi:hypothetical protein